ncbi:hypothetical protein F5144DRAFT_588008 [Chaetomium tenue]|uniref:Uncharacterized protein n=1 Tax=Chaetomium tenue TaxID=1854479 RepID=A0ACB7PK57_9PEZI|nr:hypothetical protein F5144DRAFT_588008 [Chaetomium globosum]
MPVPTQRGPSGDEANGLGDDIDLTTPGEPKSSNKHAIATHSNDTFRLGKLEKLTAAMTERLDYVLNKLRRGERERQREYRDQVRSELRSQDSPFKEVVQRSVKAELAFLSADERLGMRLLLLVQPNLFIATQNSNMASVPTNHVTPGALVNIVLKEDQPTGRTVQGVVSQLLTKGNHPRGIKVRLSDGRVGRVQSMAGGAGSTGSQIQPDGNAEAAAEVGPAGVAPRGRVRHVADARLDQGPPPSTQPVGLDAYIKPAKKRGKGKGGTGNTTAQAAARDNQLEAASHAGQSSPEEQESTCPVCGDFRGDEAALTHHVQSHFDD